MRRNNSSSKYHSHHGVSVKQFEGLDGILLCENAGMRRKQLPVSVSHVENHERCKQSLVWFRKVGGDLKTGQNKKSFTFSCNFLLTKAKEMYVASDSRVG